MALRLWCAVEEMGARLGEELPAETSSRASPPAAAAMTATRAAHEFVRSVAVSAPPFREIYA
eukprot:6207945-Pleurochrysis_carterae.AAC.2